MLTNYKNAIKNIRNELKTYIQDNKLKSLIIGVSGGVDSALCCALARPVCDELNIPLIGLSLPIESNKPDEIDRADRIGQLFCTKYAQIDMTRAYLQLLPNISGYVKNPIRMGNVKARLRMIKLYDTAHENGGLVLSTDNWTEYLLSFYTIHGDHNDYGMIQTLWKTEVYEMTKYIANNEFDTLSEQSFALKLCVSATPTDGLGITDSDMDQLGANSYKEVDEILLMYTTDPDNKTYENHPVIQRYKNTKFKRNWPIIINRQNIERED